MIIEVDKFKEQLKNYRPHESENFHTESAKLADKEFTNELRKSYYKRIIFMAGGTASGKSEYAQSYLTHPDQLTYDGTLKNFEGFLIKNQRIKKYTKNIPKIKIVYILPLDWIDAFEVFLSRERKMKIETFFETHIKSALTISKILNETAFRVEIYTSSFNKKRDKMSYHRVTLGNRKKTAKLLERMAIYLRTEAKKIGIELEF